MAAPIDKNKSNGSNHRMGISLALCAGSMAALATVSAKLAMTGDIVQQICTSVMNQRHSDGDGDTICDWLVYILRGCCFAGIFIFNALMWRFYAKSLQFCSSTIEATITNTGANFLVTAIASFTMFGEQLSVLWWIGSCFILIGLLLINKGNQEVSKEKTE